MHVFFSSSSSPLQSRLNPLDKTGGRKERQSCGKKGAFYLFPAHIFLNKRPPVEKSSKKDSFTWFFHHKYAFPRIHAKNTPANAHISLHNIMYMHQLKRIQLSDITSDITTLVPSNIKSILLKKRTLQCYLMKRGRHFVRIETTTEAPLPLTDILQRSPFRISSYYTDAYINTYLHAYARREREAEVRLKRAIKFPETISHSFSASATQRPPVAKRHTNQKA